MAELGWLVPSVFCGTGNSDWNTNIVSRRYSFPRCDNLAGHGSLSDAIGPRKSDLPVKAGGYAYSYPAKSLTVVILAHEPQSGRRATPNLGRVGIV